MPEEKDLEAIQPTPRLRNGQAAVNAYQLQDWDESHKAVAGVIARIRESLDLETIFQTTVAEVRQLLDTDRVGVFCFDSALRGRGQLISENVRSPWKQGLEIKVEDHCFGESFTQLYRQGRISAIYDIYKKGLRGCHVEILEQFQVRANLVAPLVKEDCLWGLLCIHQCSGPRVWKMPEIEFASQISQHLGVALQHTELLEKARSANAQQQALAGIIARIRQSLDLETIFKTTVREMRPVLQADRVAVFKFNPEMDWEGEFVSEDVSPYFKSGMGIKVRDRCFREHIARFQEPGRISAIADIYQTGIQPCYRQQLEQFQIRANLVAPVLKGETLWGLLCIHQCTSPRDWEKSDIEFVRQIAEHLGVALQQADYLEQVQIQSAQLAKAKEQEKAAEWQKTLAATVDKIRRSLDLPTIFQTTTREIRRLLEAERVAIFQFHPDWSGEFVAESLAPGWISVLESQPLISDAFLQETQGGRYAQNETAIVEDIYQAGYSECYICLLERLQAKAYIIAPILQGDRLWGLQGKRI